MKKRIIILGHTGLIGNALFMHLKRVCPDYEILGFSSQDINLESTQDTTKLAEYLQQDTCLIVCSFLKRQVGDNLEVFNRNIAMTNNLCQVLSGEHRVSRLIYLSSAAVYGEEVNNLQINEATAAQPTSYYGLAKFTAEGMLQMTLREQTCSLLILRPPAIYGPGDRSTGYDPAGFMKKAISGETITLWGDGTELRAFVFLNDLIEIMTNLIPDTYDGILNVADETSHTFRDIIETLEFILDQPVNWETRERTKAKVDHKFQNKAKHHLLSQWQYTSLENGLLAMYKMREAA